MNNLYFLHVDNTKFTLSLDFLQKYKNTLFYESFILHKNNNHIFCDSNNGYIVNISSKYIKLLLSLMRGEININDIKKCHANILQNILFKFKVIIQNNQENNNQENNKQENPLLDEEFSTDTEENILSNIISESSESSDSSESFILTEDFSDDEDCIFSKSSEKKPSVKNDNLINILIDNNDINNEDGSFINDENSYVNSYDNNYNNIIDHEEMFKLMTSHKLSDEYKLSKIFNSTVPVETETIKYIITPLKK
ncbi:hypothetical protein Hokovirus_2_175 [Hokovirus HKV1]|uniref:BTB domain-containing protein n=1 Tax=Hokovirus HKV1 TaxID=1977638 RepID=A0A1V0SGA1_9VIRU|nr:hypothetical protein Hokovirus_2_175 [Hokovirus HKV1]